MASKKLLFTDWNVNLITMFSTSTAQPRRTEYCAKQKGNYLKTEELDAYVSAISLRKEFNIGGKKLKDLFASIGESPKYNLGSTYYGSKYVERARELLLDKKEQEVVDIEKYISNKELMSTFNFNAHKAWYIATTAKLARTRFSGNVNYYEREKAIAEFKKHVR